MQHFWSQFLHQCITFAAILDPIGASAVMLGMLPHGMTPAEAENIARRSSLTILIAFIVVFALGEGVLRFFGINEHSLKVIGGVVLLLMALEMLGHGRTQMPISANRREDIAVIPLGIPILFGAGLFATVIIFRQQAHSLWDVTMTTAAFLLNTAAVYLALRYAMQIREMLGETGEKVVTKLMGILTGAIAVQFILGGATILVLQILNTD